VAEDAASFAEQVFVPVARRVLAMFPDDQQGRMLQSAGLKTAGKFYGFANTSGELVVKLPASRVTELIDGGRGLPCSPRPGRPMREWVCLPGLDDASCQSYLLEARDFVSKLPRG
jgi:hypothetical protein